MRTARVALMVLCMAGAAASAVTALTTAGATTAAATAVAPHAAAAWLPSTPEYWPLVVGEQATPARVITKGVDWHTATYQTVGGAQRAQIMNVDLTDANVRFGAVEAGDHLIDPADETVSSMADRTGAVAGVNGDFFAIHATGQPMGMLIQKGVLEASPVPSWPSDLEVLTSGQVEMTTETFTGTADDTTTGSTQPLVALNRIDQTGLTAVTPYLGATTIGASTIATATVGGDGALTITSVKTSQTSLPQLAAGQEDLIARRGTKSSLWLQAVHAGNTVTLAQSLAPFGIGQVETALSGGAYLVQNGQLAVPVQGGGENNVNYPITGVGVTKNGKRAIIAVFNGEATENVAVGLTRPEFAQWMLAHGAYNAIEFDSGGSTEMVGRLPGQHRVSVLSTPSDGHERAVANGLFIYSAQSSPGPAVRATVNDGNPMAVLASTTEPLGAYATDADGNPAASPVRLSVSPAGLAKAVGTGGAFRLISGRRPGRGWLIVRAGAARSRVPLTVAARPARLRVSPADPDLGNGATQQFALAGTVAEAPFGTSIQIPLTLSPRLATWRVSPARLGTISSAGLFTAAASGHGLATVRATIGGISATASVAVGSASVVVDPMTDVRDWALTATNGATATLGESRSQKPKAGDGGSMDVRYTIPAASGTSQLTFHPAGKHFVEIGATAGGRAPDAIGVWIKGIGGTPGTPLGTGQLTFAEAWLEENGQNEVFYPTAVTYDGWRLVVAAIPPGAELPLALEYLDFLVINPATKTSGDLYVADLQAIYSMRPPVTPSYTPIPDNPPWLRYTASPARFRAGGVTIAAFGDSHLTSADHHTTGSVVTTAIGRALAALPHGAAPNMVQSVGNLIDPGTLADARYGAQVLKSFGVPYHTAVGDSDIGQGANPENGNWSTVFGPTHYSYTDGAAEFIVADSAWEGLLASDPYQVPDEEQYAWLVAQLDASTSKVIVVVTHASPYDPHPIGNSQFTDRYEARMYEQLLAGYQASHPGTHVILLNGQARGFAEQVLSPSGKPDPGGLPNFDVADAGVPAYATADQGGFYNYVLFHVLPDGTVQFAVQPVLVSIAVRAPAASLAVGSSERLTAVGTTPAGDNLPPLRVPIADPASHVWSSGNPAVATVNPRTGVVVARGPGTATIRVLSGGVTGTATITVQ